jgi:hypothetical protein
MELFRIAAARGYLHPTHLLAGVHRRLTSSELVELLAYERIRPTGDRRLDLNVALMRYENAQYATHGKSHREPEDFLLFHKPAVMTKNEIKGALHSAIAKAKGKRPKKKRREKKE